MATSSERRIALAKPTARSAAFRVPWMVPSSAMRIIFAMFSAKMGVFLLRATCRVRRMPFIVRFTSSTCEGLGLCATSWAMEIAVRARSIVDTFLPLFARWVR